MEDRNIPLLDIPIDFLVGEASGKLLNEYGRFPCKIKAGVIAYCVSGWAHATINITKYEFKEHDVAILEPNTFLLIHEVSENAQLYYIGLSSSFMEKCAYAITPNIANASIPSPQMQLTEEAGDIFKNMIELLIRASNTTPPILSSEVMSNVFTMLRQIYTRINSNQTEVALQPKSRKEELYEAYSNLVLKHYTHEHQVSFYAQKMGITLPHLCTTIKQVTGKTAAKLITEAIITDAKAQLKLTNQQIKEIAISLGFENVAFFNKFFKANVKVTPKMYRNSTL